MAAATGFTDFDTQAQEIARREAIAQALLGQGLSPIPQPTNYGRLASPASPLNAVASLVQTYFGSKGVSDTEAQRVALNQAYRTALGQSTQSYINAPDRRTAAISAMGSQFPQVAKMGQDEFAQWLRDQTTQKDVLGAAHNASLPSVAAADAARAAGDPHWMDKLQPKTDLRLIEGQIADVTPGTMPKVTADLARTYAPAVVQGPSGPIAAQVQSGTGKVDVIDKTPRVNVTTVSKGPQAGAEEIFRKGGETVAKLGDIARTATSMRDNIQRMRSLEERGVFTNKQQGMEALAINILQGFGVPLSADLVNKLSNSETFNSVGIKAWQDLVNSYGGNRGVTDQEAIKIAKIVPQLSSSPGARAQLYDILQNAADRQISQFQEANSAFTEAVRQGKPELWQQQFGKVFAPTGNVPTIPAPGIGAYDKYKRQAPTVVPPSTDPFEQYKRKR